GGRHPRARRGPARGRRDPEELQDRVRGGRGARPDRGRSRRGDRPEVGEMSKDLVQKTLREASDLLARHEVSSRELTEATLRQIERTEPLIHAYVTVMTESALAAARKADAELARRGAWRGPLHGIPVAVKDICYTTDAPTEGGSGVLKGFVPDHDATVVHKLREAGAVIVGKTHTHEFAYGQNVPPTLSAWNPEHAPGGTSAGSGA